MEDHVNKKYATITEQLGCLCCCRFHIPGSAFALKGWKTRRTGIVYVITILEVEKFHESIDCRDKHHHFLSNSLPLLAKVYWQIRCRLFRS